MHNILMMIIDILPKKYMMNEGQIIFSNAKEQN